MNKKASTAGAGLSLPRDSDVYGNIDNDTFAVGTKESVPKSELNRHDVFLRAESLANVGGNIFFETCRIDRMVTARFA